MQVVSYVVKGTKVLCLETLRFEDPHEMVPKSLGTLEKRAPDPKIIGTSKKRKPWNRLLTEVEMTSLSVSLRSAMMDFLS